MSSSKYDERRMMAPTEIHIGCLMHVKRRDAIARVQGLIRRLSLAPEVTGWRIEKMPGGFAYEIQEGGNGKAYLSELLAHLKEMPDEPVHLRTSERMVRVTGSINEIRSVTLPASENPAPDDIVPRRKLRPFMPTGISGLITSAVFFSAAAVAFLTVVTVSDVADETIRNSGRVAASAAVEALPLSHWPEMPLPGKYVSRVQFSGDHWSTQFGTMSTPLIDEEAPSTADEAVNPRLGEITLPEIETRPVRPNS